VSRRRGARTIEQIRGEIEVALDRSDAERALALAREGLALRPDAEGWYLLGVALEANVELESAVAALEEAVKLDPSHADAHVALAEMASNALDFDAATEHVLDALRADPGHPDALHLRACLRERRGDHDGAARDFAAAALIDPDRFPVPPALDDDTIEAVTEEVLRSLHPSLRAYLANVPIIVDEQPSDEVLLDLPGAHPFELLGCFSGRALAESPGHDPWSVLPPTICLYRQNLQRFAHDREELVAELRVTLLHEIGHYLGLDEDDLEERGLE